MEREQSRRKFYHLKATGHATLRLQPTIGDPTWAFYGGACTKNSPHQESKIIVHLHILALDFAYCIFPFSRPIDPSRPTLMKYNFAAFTVDSHCDSSLVYQT